MNRSIIVYIIGTVLKIEAFFLLLPSITGLIYREGDARVYFATAIGAFLVGLLLAHKKVQDTNFYLKEGCVATVLSWITLSIVGGIPFYVTGEVSSFLDAMFESVSGFTTTGATFLSSIETLSHASLIWRNFIHWIGGLGVLVFLLAIVPMAGGSNINLLRSETTGPSIGKLTPKTRASARILYQIYIAITLVDAILLLLGGLSFFDAITVAFSTTSTGGFGALDTSMIYHSMYVKWVTIIFMVLSSINFNVFYLIAIKNIRKLFSLEEFRFYLAIVFVSTVMVFFNISSMSSSLTTAFTNAAFQTTAMISSTGFVSLDFSDWPALARTILLFVAIIGGCAGSTGGGFKISRVIILLKALRREIIAYLHPKSIKTIKMNGNPLDEEIVRSTSIYFFAYTFLIIASIMIISLDGQTIIDNFVLVVESLNNVGPGLSMVDPAANFSRYQTLTKIVLIVDMLAGRLEIFPLIVLLQPSIIKELFAKPARPS